MSVSTKLYKIQRGKYILYIMMHTLCVAKSWIPTVFCALKVLSHDLTLCMCTACATTVVGRSLYHYPYVWDTNLPTTVSLPQSMKTGTGWKGWNSRKFPKFRAVVGSKISAYWTSLTIAWALQERTCTQKNCMDFVFVPVHFAFVALVRQGRI